MKTNMKRIIALFLIIWLLGGCGAAPQGVPDTIVIAQGVDATTLDPHMHAETTTANVVIQIFDRLFMRDDQMVLQPHLAESGTAISDVLWEIRIKSGIQFHNGEPFNAESVKFSIERILDPETKSPQISNLNFIEKVEVVDDLTVQITTKMPYPLTLSRLSLEMVPPGYIQEHGQAYFAQHPVGTGPYRFVSWVRDEEVVLEANPDYWRGAPGIQHVKIRAIPENAVRIAALQSGSVDVIVNVPPHQMETVSQADGCRIASTQSGRFIFLQIVADRGGMLGDPRVRQALNHAVDVPALIDTILGGHGYRSTQPLTSLDFGFDPAVTGFTYDPEKAKALLREAGFPDGIDIQLDAPSGRYAMDREVAEAIVGQMAVAGIRVNLVINEWGVHIKKLLDKQMTHMFFIGWGSSLFDADATLFPQLRTGQRLTYFSNPAVDVLLDAGRSEMDPAARGELYHEAVQILQQDPPFVLLYQQEDIYGADDRLDWSPRPDELINVYQMKWKP